MSYMVEDKIFSSKHDLQYYLNNAPENLKLVALLPTRANFSSMLQRYKVGVCVVWEIT